MLISGKKGTVKKFIICCTRGHADQPLLAANCAACSGGTFSFPRIIIAMSLLNIAPNGAIEKFA